MASLLEPPPDLLPSPPTQPPDVRPCPRKSKPKSCDSVSSGERILSLIIRAIVMAAAITLFFLFASVAAVLLLHLWLAGIALRRHRNPSSNRNPNPIPKPLDLTPNLSPSELRRMPCCMWRWPWPKDQCCAVCLEKVQRGELYRMLPACEHVFHKVCVDTWLLRCPRCPLCREVVRPVG